MRAERKERKRQKTEAMRDIGHVQVLLRQWDPIGIYKGLEAEWGPLDEYDSYAPHLLGLLQRGVNAPGIEKQLGAIRREMGLFPDPTDASTAEKLIAWWQSRTA
jgi:hypothetical protein